MQVFENGAVAVDTNLDIVEHHIHPIFSRTCPNGKRRRGAISATGAISNNDQVVVGPITYVFLTTLGTPGANVVQVKIQGTVKASMQKLADAIMGKTDGLNITYETQAANPLAYGYYTSVQFAFSDTLIAAGDNVYLREIAVDTISAITLTKNGTNLAVTAFSRYWETRYVFSGNATPATNSVAGPFQMIIQPGRIHTEYDVAELVVEGVSATAIMFEIDTYYSLDEVTFVLLTEGLCLSKDSTTAGSVHFLTYEQRIPPEAGFYIKGRSSGTSAAAWVDMKVHLHEYPAGV